MGTLLERFEEHEGPVRGVNFHMTQPLFVSGGDDYKIKVWNWKTRRCLFTLTGHLDYIRTVFFHHESPWIVSASDDQTIRIWNWQSRTCVSILTGHNHYVMCAQFHPTEQLVVSASLDQTVRVWDVSGLKKKNAAGQQWSRDDIQRQGQPADIFGNNDCVNKYVLEGHARGVNWASFHPTLPLIISGADDRLIKLWRMSDNRAWEVESFRGHFSNVSCVAFHPHHDMIVSNSEDKTIRVWDIGKRACIHTFRREHDRFWVLAAHPEMNVFAAGHDSGLVVFKLEHERTPFALFGDSKVLYIRDKLVHLYDAKSQQDTSLLSLARTTSTNLTRSLSYNPVEHSILLTKRASDGALGTFELVKLPRQASPAGQPVEAQGTDVTVGNGHAVFIARNRFVVLAKVEASGQYELSVKDLSGNTTRQIPLGSPMAPTNVFFAGSRHVLLTLAHTVVLFDLETRQQTAEIAVVGVRQVCWSQDLSQVALLGKHTIVIANRELEQLCLLHETIKIKSGAWDEIGVFIYSTLNHIKYTLPLGDHGIICTVERPTYIVAVSGRQILWFNVDGQLKTLKFDPTEYRFKLALAKRRFKEVLRIIQSSNLVGQAIIAYLEKKGYPEVALHFVKDPKTRFELAIECANVDVALEMAQSLNQPEVWQTLADEALAQGNARILELAYQKLKSFDKLSFFYYATGDVEKLTKMLKIAEMRNDVASQYHNAIYLGDVEHQVELFLSLQKPQMAFLLAKTYGLTEKARSILDAVDTLTPEQKESLMSEPLLTDSEPKLLKSPIPLLKFSGDASWGRLSTANQSFFEKALLGLETGDSIDAGLEGGLEEDAMKPLEENSWQAGVLDADAGFATNSADVGIANLDVGTVSVAEGNAGAWGIEDVDLDAEIADLSLNAAAAPTSSVAGAATPGESVEEVWSRNSGNLAADYIAAGQFERALQTLRDQAGITNFALLKPLALRIYSGCRGYLTINAPTPALAIPLNRISSDGLVSPLIVPSFKSPLLDLQEAYQLTTAGKFSEALSKFQQLLLQCALAVTSDSSQHEELLKVLYSAREYVLGLKMETARREISVDTPEGAKKSAELSCYFAFTGMQPVHLVAACRSAMICNFKLKNFGAALFFAKRLIEANPGQTIADQARKVIQVGQQQPTDLLSLDFNPNKPFAVCAASFKPLYKSDPMTPVTCPYCQASYFSNFKGQLCRICQIGEIGLKASGFKTFRTRIASDKFSANDFSF